MHSLSGLNICFMVGTLGQGGAERQLYYMLCTLRDGGAIPRVLSLTRGEFWEERIQERGIQVTWVGQPKSKALRLFRIIEELRQNPPDVLQSQHFFTNLYAVAAARALHLREVGAVRGDGISELGANRGVLGQYSFLAPRIIAANSRVGIANAMALGVPRNRLHFLPNVVNTEQFDSHPRVTDDTYRVITVGRLTEEKRVDRFLRVLYALRARVCRPVKGTIVGDGPLRESLEAQATALGLSDGHLEFLGPRSEVASLYREADVFVLTSDWEGTPNVVLEAMASALPVVSTAVGGVPEVIRDGVTGMLAEPSDEEALSEKVARVLTDSRLRVELACRGREFVRGHHSLTRLPQCLEEFYSSVLNNHHQ